jgi:hypothetical protein
VDAQMRAAHLRIHQYLPRERRRREHTLVPAVVTGVLTRRLFEFILASLKRFNVSSAFLFLLSIETFQLANNCTVQHPACQGGSNGETSRSRY